MRPVTLRVFLPALLIAVTAACLTGFLTFQYYNRVNQLIEWRREQASYQLGGLQHDIEAAWNQRRPAAARRELTHFGTLSDYTTLTVIDGSGKVLFANHPGWSGKPLHSVLPTGQAVPDSLGLQPASSSGDDARIDAVLPLHLDGVGDARLYARYDLRPRIRALRDRLIQEGWLLSSVMLVVTVGVLALLQWLVLSPLRRFIDAAKRLAAGEYGTRLGTFPTSEFSELAAHLNNASHALRDNLDSLVERQAVLEVFADALPDAAAILSEEGDCLAVFGDRRLLHPGVALAASHQEPIGDRLPAEHTRWALDIIEGTLAGGVATTQQYESETAFGIRRFSARLIPLEQPLQGHRAVMWLSTDITESERMQRELELMAAAFETHEGIAIVDSAGNVRKTNQEFTRITGYSAEECRGRNVTDLLLDPADAARLPEISASIRTNGHWSGEVWHRRRDNTRYPTLQTVTAVSGGGDQPGNYVVVFMDITARKEAERIIAWQARYDPLTELPNRRHLSERLDEQLALARRHGFHGCVLFIDLDYFMRINDSLGHDVGDHLLCAVVERIQQRLRREDFLARVGGDEFVVLLPAISQNAAAATTEAEKLARVLLELLAAPFALDGRELYINASIGLCAFPSQARNSQDTLRRAETAMYTAKRLGRGTVQQFDTDMEIDNQQRLQRLGEIHRALENDEFVLHYQPQFNRDGSMIGAEALIRWQHPVHGILPPGEFIPIAEESGLILRIGDWVLREAADQRIDWFRRGVLPPAFRYLSVNVSARQFSQPGFADSCIGIANETGADPQWLELELTESVIADNLVHVRESLTALREAGFHIAVDDFGTGYCSLHYLKRLPVQTLKIDKSFVRDLSISDSDARIVETILAMARHLKLRVVAEGVETGEQFAFLRDRGCAQFQGFLFSRPVPAAELEMMFQHGTAAGGA